MKKIDLGQSMTILANLGVIAGIFFLAVEVQQNTGMMEAQTRDSVTSKQIEYYLTISQNEFAADTLTKGRLGQLNAESTEATAFFFMTTSLFRTWENEWYQYDKGLFEEQEFLARSNNWAQLLNLFPGYKAHWEVTSTNYSVGFVDYVTVQLNQHEN